MFAKKPEKKRGRGKERKHVLTFSHFLIFSFSLFLFEVL